MNRPARFTVADVRRAIKAAEQSGSDYAVEIATDGTIRIVRDPKREHAVQPSIEQKKVLVF